MLLRVDPCVECLSLIGSCGQQFVVWPLAESVGFGWVLWLVGDVGGMLVVGLVSDMLVGCGCGIVRCRFRIR